MRLKVFSHPPIWVTVLAVLKGINLSYLFPVSVELISTPQCSTEKKNLEEIMMLSSLGQDLTGQLSFCCRTIYVPTAKA